MHELSLATAMIEQLQAAAIREGASRIVAIEVVLGALSGVERDPLEFCFPVAAEGSMAEGAELRIEEQDVKVRCGACSHEGSPEPPGLACPACGSLAVEVLEGRDFRVRAMEVQ